ncbi:MAG: endolytic transglycosylase MltG [Alphaproteobacteria bacterium]|nr:endolytic transglycosylase MltG [Alphaproteobacteria bacterium]MCL2889827.1 endolytic transglycosylase MltG [Alphaproteobacteria bacterium]
MKKKHKKFLKFGAGIIIFVALFSIWFLGIHSHVRVDTTFDIGRGASVAGVAADLKSQKLIGFERPFKLLVRAFGGNVKRGMYDIPRGASVWRIARIMSDGRVATTTIMIPEGLTVRQIIALLNANQFLTGDSCPPRNPICYAEGELFPNTYIVAKGTSRAAVLDLMRREMQRIEKNWIESGMRAPPPLKNWNEIITLASIVQKETPKKAEMPKVASVFINRLRKGMRLQADPTVVYAITDGLGDMQGKPILTRHLQTSHPHNTYMNHGLPPHPIASVGRDAIRSVLNPADTNYYFFVADGTGGHVFAKDYEQHKINHANWRIIRSQK